MKKLTKVQQAIVDALKQKSELGKSIGGATNS